MQSGQIKMQNSPEWHMERQNNEMSIGRNHVPICQMQYQIQSNYMQQDSDDPLSGK